jgi:GTPase
MIDSAGHPRYRRTTVRGLVGWAPHWILLSMAAGDGENGPNGTGGTSLAQELLGTVGFHEKEALPTFSLFNNHQD